MRCDSPARPQPCSSSLPPPSVYITESRSGQTRRPKRVMSSAVLPMTVIVALGAAASRPRRKRAAPMPPASTVIRMDSLSPGDRPAWTPLLVTHRDRRRSIGYAEKFFTELTVHLGQPGGQYHVPRLT